jgi:DNA-binding MarR family transcriptional regulator
MSALYEAQEGAAAGEAELAFAGLSDLLGFQVRQAHMAMHRDFNASLAALSLTQRQAALMWLIDANPGVSQAVLAGALGIDRATTMALVDRLEKAGLASRTRSPNDRRRQELHLTLAGQRVLADAKKTIAAHERRFAKRLNGAELSGLLAGLKKLSAR